jgi:tRNA/tmRNA/rRNA uracil-C5-methylase (TrmA/RlmC/RlmD family)
LVQDAAAALRARLNGPPLDLLVLDPPRSGAAELVDSIARARPRWVAYCSCDPVTLSRDLGALVQRGYLVESVRGFDMFPGTHHVETLAWLRCSDDGPNASG